MSTWGALLTEWGSDFDTFADAFATEMSEAIAKQTGKRRRKVRLQVEERNKLFFKKAQLQTIVRDEVVYDLEKLYDVLGLSIDEVISKRKLKERIKEKLWQKLLYEAKKNNHRIPIIKDDKMYKFVGGVLKSKPIDSTDYKLIKESYSKFTSDKKTYNKIIKEQNEINFKNELLALIEKYKPSFNSIKSILNERYGKKKPTSEETKKSKLYNLMNSKWGLKDGTK